jgi:hypothetical protein
MVVAVQQLRMGRGVLVGCQGPGPGSVNSAYAPFCPSYTLIFNAFTGYPLSLSFNLTSTEFSLTPATSQVPPR